MGGELTPLVLHVMDSSSSSSIAQPLRVVAAAPVPIQLTMDNYLMWKSLFIPILRAHDMINIAEGTEECPPQFLITTEDRAEEKECWGFLTDHDKKDQDENPAYTNWIKNDQTFLTLINASLSPSLFEHTIGCTSGRALWLRLENLLAATANARLQELKDRLKNLKLDTPTSRLNLKCYFDSAKQIEDELVGLTGSRFDAGEFVSCILGGLPSEYDRFVSSHKYDDLVSSIRDRPLLTDKLYNMLLVSSPSVDPVHRAGDTFSANAFFDIVFTICAFIVILVVIYNHCSVR